MQTTCCIVGGGPAGVVLAYLLARHAVPVVLLEEHKDFDREFRGDTLHPSVMEILAELGLAERLLQLRHTKVRSINVQTPAGPARVKLDLLKTPYPYITLLPQVDFLNFMSTEAAQYPAFTLVMGARVEGLIEENGQVRGVRYRTTDGTHNLRATLTVAADGRFSRVRKLAGLEPVRTSPPMDVVWFRLPRQAGDSDELIGRGGNGHLMVLLNRFDYWQAGYIIAKDGFKELRAQGLDRLRAAVAELVPEVADRLHTITDWKQLALLSVESSRLREWFRPGLLLIGDAAHAMSPVGGVGINYAIQDAVAAANVLTRPLQAGYISRQALQRVQRERELPTRIIQAFQTMLQRQVLGRILDGGKPFRIPLLARLIGSLPFTRRLVMRLIAFGVRPAHVKI